MSAPLRAIALWALAALPASAQDARLERFEWGKEVDGDAPIRALELRNDYGDIRARATDERRVAVSAVIQRLDPAPQGVGVSVERRGPLLAIVVGYPPGHVQDSDPSASGDRIDRVDVTVLVPEGLALDATTLRGGVEVDGLRGDVRVRTASGDVSAALNPAGGVHQLRLESDSGAISVMLPAAVDVELHAESTGDVTADFKLKRRRVGPRIYAEARLGRGGPTLYVFSETGALSFAR